MESEPADPVTEEKLSSRDDVAQLMHQRIAQYLAARSDPDLYRSVRNMSQFVSDDYGSRFLVELIQNAHDAHAPGRTDGEIAIVLSPSEGEFGCLYIANRGIGFSRRNLKAITNIALSSKPVNAGIGNKGLGFRSVLQVCDWPEIYSVLGEGGSGSFDGYCFRFATIDDFRNLLGDEQNEVAQEMASNLPCWHVPIPVEPSVQVAQFASAGFATVVRLPLKSSGAFGVVKAQLESLLGLEAPLHLFLDRIARISLDMGVGQSVFLDRNVLKSWSHNPRGFEVDTPIEVSRVRVGITELIVASWDIDDKLFREALKTSLEKNEVPESWRDWEGAARVSIAVPLGAPLNAGRLYCFLPLGKESEAPFAGYINANFYTKMDRTKVNPSLGLNDLFLRKAAWLSCQLIGFLVEKDWSMAANAVVTLLCWDKAYLEIIRQAMGDNGKGVLNRKFLPVRGPADTVIWSSPKATTGWLAPPDACLSPKIICDVGGGLILIDSLTLNQRTALDRLYVLLRGCDFTPPVDVIADWVEKIAIRMHEEGASPERWAIFYDEIAVALESNASSLFGKRFLLSVSGELISSEIPAASTQGRSRRAADVYFAPVMTVDADVDDDESKQSLPLEHLPATLRKGFALLSREVPWLKDDGGHRLGRSFLIAGKLVREYDTRDVLRTLAAVTRTASDDRTREQALEWGFRLWSSGRSLSNKETLSAGFFVPTTEGWIDASAAMFGIGWDVPNGRKLHELLRATAERSEDLHRAMGRLLLHYATWPITQGNQSDWIRFLTAVGVRDCLRPVGGESVITEPIGLSSFLPTAIANHPSLISADLRAHWREILIQDCAQMYTSRQYRAEIRPWRIPGQSEHKDFLPEVRRDYAVQIALAMREVGDEHRKFRAVRADTGSAVPENHRLSTPFFAFLTGAEWMPVTRPGGQFKFIKPIDAWYFDSEDERPPRFLDFVVRHVATALDTVTLEWMRLQAKLGLFNDVRHAGRALSVLVDAASTGITDIRDIRRYKELFQRLWTIARRSGVPKAGAGVPVFVNGEIRVVSAKINDQVLAYFDDERDGLKKQLLEEVGEPVFDFVSGDTEALWEWVNASVPGRFRRISDEPAEVYVDGKKFDESTQSQLLSNIVGSWIVDFLVCVAEHKSSAFVQATQKSLGRIRRAALGMTVVSGQKIEIAHGDERIALPTSLRGALALRSANGTVLIIQTLQAKITLEHLSASGEQLAVALGARELAHGLDAALLRLASVLRERGEDVPNDSTMAATLGIELDAIRKTRRLVSGDLIGLLDLAIPLSACVATPETTLSLQALALQDSPHDEELRLALEALASKLGLSLLELEDRMVHLVDLADLKSEFLLPISRLNSVIGFLGGRYKPVSNEQIHRDTWMRHLRQRMPIILEQLRSRAVGTFDRMEPLHAYTKARDEANAIAISPDTAWFTMYDELPEAVMDANIDKWVVEQFANGQDEVSLSDSITEIRALNASILREFWGKFSPILAAWSRLPSTVTTTEIRQFWINPEVSRDRLFSCARDEGWIDFRVLDDFKISKWMENFGRWPVGIPPSVEYTAWGLSTDNVMSSEDSVRAERAERLRRRTLVQFAGVTMSALADSFANIAEAVAARVGDSPALEQVSSTEAKLETWEPAKQGGMSGGGSGGGAGPRLPESGMSDEQKSAIGLIGELWAREWIRRRHNLESVDESIWVSCYRNAILNTSGGSDSLGYDFIVATKSRTYYYEVKASTGDPRRFELGPTEIFAGQRYRADVEHRFRILYLAYVNDPSRLTATLLSNPFSAKAEGKFRPVGKGSVIYEFDPVQ